MLERTFHSYSLKPKAYPYHSARHAVTGRTVRRIKLPTEYSGIVFDLDYKGNLYPSSRWLTENRRRFTNCQPTPARCQPKFEATTLDTRKHNPQSRHIFHINRINKKPICCVETQLSSGPVDEEEGRRTTIYQWSYQDRDRLPNEIIHRQQRESIAEGIVPVKLDDGDFDARTEMMLPVCDSTNMPSADNPHRYLVRKRKVPPPVTSSGVVYPKWSVSIPPGEPPSSNTDVPDGDENHVSVSSLSGMPFSRRRHVNPPPNNVLAVPHLRSQSPVCVSSLAGKNFTRRRQIRPQCPEIYLGFDGGVDEREGVSYDDRVLPFMKAKPVI